MATAALVAGALLPPLAYLRASGAVLRPLGPDLFGYIWQTRIIGHAPLSGIDPRPGVPVLGSVLAGFRVTWDWSAALVLAPVMIVALGFAVAVALRIALPLPRWTLGVLGFVVSLWGGSIYLAQGHLANLLSLVCIVPAVLLLAIPSGTWTSRMIGATAMATASGLAHAGFLPFYTAAAGLWLLLSIPSLLRARRQGRRWWEEPSCSFVLALLMAAAVVAVVIFGAMGTSVDGFTNIDDGISEYGDRLARITGVVGLWVSRTSVLAFIGIVAARRLAGPRSRALTLLGLAWMTVSLVGGLVAVALPSFPGHRALASILPLAALCGLGIVGVALVALGSTTTEAADRRTRIGPLRASLAAFIVISLSVLVVSPNLERLTKRAKRNDKGEVAQTIASYVATVDPEGPVVVLVDPSQRMDALSWRGRQNQVRGLAPTASIDRIFFLVGQLGEDLMPVQTVAPENAGDPAFVYAMRQSWSTGAAALREDAIILVAQAYVPPEVWDQLARSSFTDRDARAGRASRTPRIPHRARRHRRVAKGASPLAGPRLHPCARPARGWVRRSRRSRAAWVGARRRRHRSQPRRGCGRPRGGGRRPARLGSGRGRRAVPRGTCCGGRVPPRVASETSGRPAKGRSFLEGAGGLRSSERLTSQAPVVYASANVCPS